MVKIKTYCRSYALVIQHSIAMEIIYLYRDDLHIILFHGYFLWLCQITRGYGCLSGCQVSKEEREADRAAQF